MDDHLERFQRSASLLSLPFAHPPAEVKHLVRKLLQSAGLPEAGIRLLLTGGYTEDGFAPAAPNFIVIIEKPGPVDPLHFEKGIALMTHEFQRELPQVKTTNYLTAISLQAEKRQKGVYDILYRHNGKALELTRSNFFIVKNGEVATAADHVLHGITRKKVLALARPHFAVAEREVAMAEVWEADEAFITGTTKKVMPVIEIEGRKIGAGARGPVTQRLQRLFASLEDEAQA